MQVDGVPGPATVQGYAGWFVVNDVSWNLERSNSAVPNSIIVSAPVAAGFAPIAQASASGALFRKLVVDMAKPLGSSSGQMLLTIRLICEDAQIRSFQGSIGDDDPTGSARLDIRCARLHWEYYDLGADGKIRQGLKGSWNFKNNTP